MAAGLLRKWKSQGFLKFKASTAGLVIKEEEVKKYFEAHRVKFGELEYSQMKEQIREYLLQERMEKQMKDWFELLRKKYRVRRLPRHATR